MPFTIEGNWIPSKPNESPKPVKVRLIKRGKSLLTVILNLSMPLNEKEELASALKKNLGCGGSVKEDTVEIQGDKVEAVKKWLLGRGIKAF
jgi:translation initiation factor 1